MCLMNQTKGNFKVILTFKYAFDLFYHDSGGTWEAKSHTVRNFNRLNTSVFRDNTHTEMYNTHTEMY